MKGSSKAFWPGRNVEPNRLDPLAKPEFTPTFKLRPGEKVFTIGSCFARNIEAQLAKLGYQIPSASYVPEELVGKPLDGFFNKFSPQSMLNEVEWALDPDTPFDPRHAFLEQPNGSWIDGQLMSKIEVTHDRALKRRKEIGGLFKFIPQCRIVIITLGLVEVWWDIWAGRYLNRNLPGHNAKTEPDRFELHVLAFDELYNATRRLLDLILTNGHPESRILLTVSPVPLTATYAGTDVLVANCYSKSVLRAVAEHLTDYRSRVDYFPSYESVTLSDRSLSWQDDLIHVKPDIVALNVARMVAAYAPAERVERK